MCKYRYRQITNSTIDMLGNRLGLPDRKSSSGCSLPRYAKFEEMFTSVEDYRYIQIFC